jgi:hypothetical protein
MLQNRQAMSPQHGDGANGTKNWSGARQFP